MNDPDELTIQDMLVAARLRGALPDLAGNIAVTISNLQVATFYWIDVPTHGWLSIALLKYPKVPRFAVDIRVEAGGLMLNDGTSVPILRTWADSGLEDELKYRYASKGGRICITVANERTLPSGRLVLDRLVGNSGFWIRSVADALEFHASASTASPPDFEQFVFQVQAGTDSTLSRNSVVVDRAGPVD